MKDQDLAFASILRDGTRIYFANFARFSGVALLAQLPVLVLSVMDVLIPTDDPSGQSILGRLSGFASTIALAITSAYLVPSVVSALGGAAAPRDVGPRISSALGTAWLSNLAIGLGLLCFIVPGIVAGIYYCVAIPAAVVEGLKAGEAMKRSGALTEGRRGLALLLFVFYALVFVGAMLAAYVPLFTLIATETTSGVATDPLTVILALLPPILGAGLVSAYGACIFAVFYVRLREDKDGIDAAAVASVFS